MNDTPKGIGIIGCGNISRRYVAGMARFPELRLIGCADVVAALATTLAADAGIRAYATIDELLNDPNIDVVVNITPPLVHADVTIAALRAGKSVYVEKPIAASTREADRMIAAAKASGQLLGAAPDTFLGSASQTARAAVDRGEIGEVIGASAFVTHSKAETWHPNPTFLFQPGGGPALDLGPYYITWLVNCLGPVAQVSAFSRIGAAERVVTADNRAVDSITVTTPTHAGATLRFASGAIGTVMFSFDVWDANLPFIELYGTLGTLSLSDPNQFDGPIRVHSHQDSEWRELAPVIEPSGVPDGAEQYMRGLGVSDLVGALNGKVQRATPALARHVLEVLEAIEQASETSSVITIQSAPDRPAPRLAGATEQEQPIGEFQKVAQNV